MGTKSNDDYYNTSSYAMGLSYANERKHTNQLDLSPLTHIISKYLLVTSTKIYLSFSKQPLSFLRGYVIVDSTIKSPYCKFLTIFLTQPG